MVVDPDGWRGGRHGKLSWDEPITWRDYLRRAAVSTTMSKRLPDTAPARPVLGATAVLDAIGNIPVNVFAIAQRLGVPHTSTTLRHLLAELAGTSQIFTDEDTDGTRTFWRPVRADALPDGSVVATVATAWVKNHPSGWCQWRGTNGGWFTNEQITDALVTGAVVLRHGTGVA